MPRGQRVLARTLAVHRQRAQSGPAPSGGAARPRRAPGRLVARSASVLSDTNGVSIRRSRGDALRRRSAVQDRLDEGTYAGRGRACARCGRGDPGSTRCSPRTITRPMVDSSTGQTPGCGSGRFRSRRSRDRHRPAGADAWRVAALTEGASECRRGGNLGTIAGHDAKARAWSSGAGCFVTLARRVRQSAGCCSRPRQTRRSNPPRRSGKRRGRDDEEMRMVGADAAARRSRYRTVDSPLDPAPRLRYQKVTRVAGEPCAPRSGDEARSHACARGPELID